MSGAFIWGNAEPELAALTRHARLLHRTIALQHLGGSCSSAASSVKSEEGRLAFIGAILSAPAPSTPPPSAVASHSDAILNTLAAGLRSPNVQTRLCACDVLSIPGLVALQGGAGGFDAFGEALRLASGGELDGRVRAGASRALGLLVKSAAMDGRVSCWSQRLPAEDLKRRVLMDPLGLCRTRRSWARCWTCWWRGVGNPSRCGRRRAGRWRAAATRWSRGG